MNLQEKRFLAHWVDYVACGVVAFFSLAFLIAGLPWYLAGSMLIVALVAVASIHLEHKFFILEAKSGGLLWGSGAIQRQRSQLAWSQIVSVELSQTGMARFLNYHHVVVTTTGWQKVLFKKIAAAEDILVLWEHFKTPTVVINRSDDAVALPGLNAKG